MTVLCYGWCAVLCCAVLCSCSERTCASHGRCLFLLGLSLAAASPSSLSSWPPAFCRFVRAADPLSLSLLRLLPPLLLPADDDDGESNDDEGEGEDEGDDDGE